MPTKLEEATDVFIEYYDYHLYREGLGNTTLHDGHIGKLLTMIDRRRKVKSIALTTRRSTNRMARRRSNSR